ncbi:hypothetical protein, partial [Acidithiobacillus ferriphilus]|uniref:hypothetical protein n=1 Tax=Acidithiobacillus ferriphilus TaxID=1689834 RepID=UPI001C0647DB
LEQPALTNQILRGLVVSQQAVQQFITNSHLQLLSHRTAVSCQMTIYTKILTPPPAVLKVDPFGCPSRG